MKNILLLAYQCSPYRGSEYSVAWNYIFNMSIDNRLFVLLGTSGDHMGDFTELDEYLSHSSVPNVTFVKVEPNGIVSTLNGLNKRGILTYSFYLAYRIWHKQVFTTASQILAEHKIDVIHYLTPIGYREPGMLWKLDIPYIWGPVGGSLNYPLHLSKGLSLGRRCKYVFRSLANSIQIRYSLRVRKAITKTDVFLTATSADRDNFLRFYHIKSIVLPENCILRMNTAVPINYSGILNVGLIGSVDERKNCRLMLDALSLARNRNNIRLHIAGDGHQRKKLEKYCSAKGMDGMVIWYGQIPRNSVYEFYKNIHIMAVTSLCESNPTTIWEALSFGLPVLTLDHCGPHDTVSNEYGFKIPINLSYEVVAEEFAKCLDLCVESPEIIREKSMGAIAYAKGQLWKSRVEFWNRIYDTSILRHISKI